jgi:choline dehydrogenase-like flavoprotein
MVHAANRLFIKLKRGPRAWSFNMNHGLSLNDYYVHNGTKLGNIHAHLIATRDAILRFLVQNNIGLKHLPGPLLSVLTSMVSFAHRSWTVFAMIVEDLPYPVNYVSAKAGSEEDILCTYRYPDELRLRAQIMRDEFKRAVDPVLDVRPLEPLGELNLSHACGTCRFGDNPKTSVLDSDNRAHDLDNLYILDASFFPSSGGINPSLTIVANSLRATDKIAKRL